MLNQIIKRFYSRLIIPYNPKGLKAVSQSENITNFLNNHWEMTDLSEFRDAFTSLLDSIDQPDFPEYVNNVCDPLLAEGFLKGKQYIENEQLKMEKVIDDTIQEDVICSQVSLLLSLNPEISLFENEQVYMQDKGNLTVAAFVDSRNKKTGMNLLLDMYIRSNVSWIIQGQQYNSDRYHLVRFLAYHQEEPVGFFKCLKAIYTKQTKKILFGDNPEWRIVDVDNFMKQKYPEIM